MLSDHAGGTMREPGEVMTIEVVSAAKDGAIHVSWEKTKDTAHFSQVINLSPKL